MLEVRLLANEGVELAGSSVYSRAEILLNSGVEQLVVNPIFGDLAVDYAIGRPGYYIHSIVTIQTHLGIIGSTLFFPPIFSWIKILFMKRDLLFLKFLSVVIMVSSLFIEIFTWMPLWFLIGALYAAQPVRRRIKETSRSVFADQAMNRVKV